MKLLAIETATEACSTALFMDDELTQRYAVEPRGHSELVLAMMDELLAESGVTLVQLDALAFGRGPGSFTGVRIATGVVQGAALGAALPVVPVSTLAALAQRCHSETGARRILPAFDARVNEVYWAAYEAGSAGLVEPVGEEQVCAADAVMVPAGEGWHGVGTGWRTYEQVLRRRIGRALVAVDAALFCSAREVAILGVAGYRAGQGVSAEHALPVYLRNQVARKPR